ncbi:caspase family protein [Sphingobacterium sp. LRF_L2]|uniref:caspase family protein n=1 Tax=Sphingobacterium sp. LRF_L2 TaxID=3369421 RepID=UPI003F5D69EF
MKVLAICIGVDNAGNFTKLDNAINDATSINEVFKSFDYDTRLYQDISMNEWIALSQELNTNLKNYDAFIFFYAGHGIEVAGENYLTFQETCQDQEGKAYYDRYSIKLSEILELEKTNLGITKIIIVDACRDNPRGVRGIQAQEFAPIATPRGTLIAFSTTSGEKAADGGFEKNSAYTGTLVQHLKSNTSIQAESLFKKVRQSVYSLTQGKKVTWEHTSLINEFFFQKPLPIEVDFGYPNMYINDSSYDYSDQQIQDVIILFKTADWYSQRDAIEAFLLIQAQRLLPNEKFIIGRWLVRAYSNGTFKAKNILDENIVTFLVSYREVDNKNHLLNGMLFELYFNEFGQFRFASENIDVSNILIELRNNKLFDQSFQYLNGLLMSYSDKLLYYPITSNNNLPVSLDVLAEEEEHWLEGKQQIIYSINSQAKDITEGVIAIIGSSIGSKIQFEKLLTTFNIPQNLIMLNSNIPLHEIEIRRKVEGLDIQDNWDF